MTELEVLNGVAEFLKKSVAPFLNLKKERRKTDEEYKLVNPAVYVSYVPPKGFRNDYNFSVPCFLVMSDSGKDDNDAASLMIRIKVVTFDDGEVQADGKLIPTVDGYKDILNCFEKIRLKIAEKPVINKKVNNEKPIEWAIDEDIKYPIWSGELKFPVSILKRIPNIDNLSDSDYDSYKREKFIEENL